MKNVDQLYEKFYNAYKNDYDNDELSQEAKKKTFDYKQFEFIDETDKKSKIDEETEIFLRRLKIEKRVLIKWDL